MNKTIPLVSIIMSSFNEEQYISDSISSMLNQSFEDFEFLILDDGSSDRTYEILESFTKLDKRVKIFKNEKNLGLTKSLNILISNSNSKYIARQDSDDISHRDRLKTQINFLENNNFVGCSVRANRKNSRRNIPFLSNYLPLKFVVKFKNPLIHGTLMINRLKMQEIGNYDERFYYAQDYKLISDLVSKNLKFKRLNSILYTLNMENNISKKFKNEQKYFSDCVKNNKVPKGVN